MSSAFTFVMARDPMPWRAAHADGPGLPGGAELATVRLAEGLAAGGREVTVHANVEREEEHRGVRYAPREALDRERPVRALVAVSAPEALEGGPPAGARVLWLHRPDAGASLTPERAARADAVLALSGWHARRLADRHPEVAGRVVAFGNGVELELFSARAGRERHPRVLSTSQPERGLDVLLELWPSVRERVPGAELAFTQAPAYAFIARGANPAVAAHRRRVAGLAAQPGVSDLGVLDRSELAEQMARARVWAHASWHSVDSMPFAEVSCIAALEAQAAGMWCVASALGALPETVRVGSLVDAAAAPGGAWRDALAEEIARGLTDPSRAERAEVEGPAAVAHLDWPSLASRLVAIADGAAR